MKLSILQQNKKGIYTIITTFLFIIIVIFVVLSITYYGRLITDVKKDTNEDLNQYEIIKDVRDRLYYCYGQPFVKNKLDNGSCINDLSMIKRYEIQEINYSAMCHNKTWQHNNTELINKSASHRYIYRVPIQDGGNICSGKLIIVV